METNIFPPVFFFLLLSVLDWGPVLFGGMVALVAISCKTHWTACVPTACWVGATLALWHVSDRLHPSWCYYPEQISAYRWLIDALCIGAEWTWCATARARPDASWVEYAWYFVWVVRTLSSGMN